MPGVHFLPFSVLLGLLGILCVGLTGFWSQYWHGGFAWDGSPQMFNWHPVLMVTGLLVLYGTGKWFSKSFLIFPPILKSGEKLLGFWGVFSPGGRWQWCSIDPNNTSPLTCSGIGVSGTLLPGGVQTSMEAAACNIDLNHVYPSRVWIGCCVWVS